MEPYAHGLLEAGDGHRVYWEECGDPERRPAVVLHGGPGSGCTPAHRSLFDPALFRIVLLDQRGCGRSTPRVVGQHAGAGSRRTSCCATPAGCAASRRPGRRPRRRADAGLRRATADLASH